jgi:hypothetical protein
MGKLKTALDPVSVSGPRPLPAPEAYLCDYLLCIGVFMDDTSNNKHVENKNATSNVASLWDACRKASPVTALPAQAV